MFTGTGRISGFDTQADPAVYYPKSRITRRTVTYFPSLAYAFLPKADRPVFPYDARWDVHIPRSIPDKVLRRIKAGKGREWYDESEDGKARHEVREWVRKEDQRRAEKMPRIVMALVCHIPSREGQQRDIQELVRAGTT